MHFKLVLSSGEISKVNDSLTNPTISTSENSIRTPTPLHYVNIDLENAFQITGHREPQTNSSTSAPIIANSSAQNSTKTPTLPYHVGIIVNAIQIVEVPVTNSSDSSSDCPDISGIATLSMSIVFFFVNMYDL